MATVTTYLRSPNALGLGSGRALRDCRPSLGGTSHCSTTSAARNLPTSLIIGKRGVAPPTADGDSDALSPVVVPAFRGMTKTNASTSLRVIWIGRRTACVVAQFDHEVCRREADVEKGWDADEEGHGHADGRYAKCVRVHLARDLLSSIGCRCKLSSVAISED